MVSGVHYFVYWTSNFFLDFIKHIVPAVFCSLMIKAFNIKTFNEPDVYGCMTLMFFGYGWCVIPFTYSFSFLF